MGFFPSKSGDVKEISVARNVHLFSDFILICGDQKRPLLSKAVLCAAVSGSGRGHAVCQCAVLMVLTETWSSRTLPCFTSSLWRKGTICVSFWLYLIKDVILCYYFIVKIINFLCLVASQV